MGTLAHSAITFPGKIEPVPIFRLPVGGGGLDKVDGGAGAGLGAIEVEGEPVAAGTPESGTVMVIGVG